MFHEVDMNSSIQQGEAEMNGILSPDAINS